MGDAATIAQLPGSILELVPDGSNGQTQRYRYIVAGVEIITAHDADIDGLRKLRLWMWDAEKYTKEASEYLDSYNGTLSNSGLLISGGAGFDASMNPWRMIGNFFERQKTNPSNGGSASNTWCPKVKIYKFDSPQSISNG